MNRPDERTDTIARLHKQLHTCNESTFASIGTEHAIQRFMFNISRRVSLIIGLTALALAGGGKAKTKVENSGGVLWRAPDDIGSRNLLYGPGGREHEPRGVMTFEEEDHAGSNPKFIVRDSKGVKWTVKLGNEARPETVASRLVWAAGYFANEDYFVADLRVEGMPPHLKRGSKLVTEEGARNARLKRHNPDEKKVGEWSWRDDPFKDSREWNGLRALMALINNWDLKDSNNAIYENKKTGERYYMISDLGAAFGAAGEIYPPRRSKGDLEKYVSSRFIRSETGPFVDFATPARPSWKYTVVLPQYLSRIRLEWIGRHVPRSDARWMGELLSRLSKAQIRDAFRAAGYSEAEIDQFASVMEARISVLRDL